MDDLNAALRQMNATFETLNHRVLALETFVLMLLPASGLSRTKISELIEANFAIMPPSDAAKARAAARPFLEVLNEANRKTLGL